MSALTSHTSALKRGSPDVLLAVVVSDATKASCQPPNKQLERTVIRQRVRAACAPFHYAHAARWTARHAAAQLQRYAPVLTYRLRFTASSIVGGKREGH
jgi:hypothetical protein